MDNTEVNSVAKDISKTIDKDTLNRLIKALGRRKNKVKLSKEVIYKKEKAKKAKRRESNKSRKINQAKNRHNKFTR